MVTYLKDGPRKWNAKTIVFFVACAALCVACGKKDETKPLFGSGRARPDSFPVMLNKDMPFRYPPALYAEKVQGNVTLRLYVDTAGSVIDDSTRVVESSKSPMLDSAATKGARELHFVPAKLRGKPMSVSILFPVYFRHPEATPPAGDSVLNRRAVRAGDSTKAGLLKDTAQTNSSSKKKISTSRRRQR